MTTNSFIFTRGGLSVVIANKPYNVESTHTNFNAIIDALKRERWSDIPELANVSLAVKRFVDDQGAGNVTVDAEAGIVNYLGEPVENVVADHIIKMMRDGFSIKPLCLFLDNLLQNPSKKAVDQLYTWMIANGMTVSEDGHLLAFKRVQDDYTSFHDDKTKNDVGTYVEMPRYKVEDRSEHTCAPGLHFCSQAYLPSYSSGRGRVLLLKINPRDVVSIPTDYESSKGRACKYLVLEELKGDTRAEVEVKNPMPQPVLAEKADINAAAEYKQGYASGYRDGRGKKARYYWEEFRDEYEFAVVGVPQTPNNKALGYLDGYKDGRAKKPKLY